MKKRNDWILYLAMVGLAACGQAPSFVDQGQGALGGGSGGGSGGEPGSEPGTGDVVEGGDGSTSGDETHDGGTVPGGSPVVFHTDPSDPNSPTFVIPDIKPGEADQVAQCIKKWKKVPFTGTLTNVRRIKASVSVMGIGNPINDVAQTSTPALILVDAGVNVMGKPTYNMLNDNGYYCIKVNVNVLTELNVNLACNAHLADNSVQVNVGSNTNSTTGMIGVNVGGSVTVNRMTPAKSACSN